MDAKGLVLKTLYGRWPKTPLPAEGYAILIAMPMDMPFLLRFALEGLQQVDTTNCRQILVVPDGFGDDGGAALRQVMDRFDDPRLTYVPIRPADRFMMRRTSVAHWVCIVCGMRQCTSEYVFLHDADAFFLESDSVEKIYAYCQKHRVSTTGVDARIDPFFIEHGYTIPGTWQMMFASSWLRTHPPHRVYGRTQPTPHGPHEFDTLLYPQLLDYQAGGITVMDDPPPFVHFNGTIVTYRAWRKQSGPVVDELYRLLLLSMLEDVVSSEDRAKLLPPVAELAKGLDDANQPVHYTTGAARKNYRPFRGMLEQLAHSPLFPQGAGQRLIEKVRPFDEYYGDRDFGAAQVAFRRDGLGQMG